MAVMNPRILLKLPPFAVQVTAVLVVPETVTVKFVVALACTVVVAGANVIVTPEFATTFALMPVEVTAPGSGFFTVTETVPI